MSEKLRVLLVEDSESDAALTVRLLEKARYEVQWQRVESTEGMQAALAAQPWDIVICDHSMPNYNAPAALADLQKSGLDVPFIVVSGTIGEEPAVAVMRAGAHDYLMKGNLARLGPAVARELLDAQNRRHGREADEALRVSEERWKFAIEAAGDGVWDWDYQKGEVLYSKRWKKMLGYEEQEVGVRVDEWTRRVHPEDMEGTMSALQQHLNGKSPAYSHEIRMRCKNGQYKWVLTRGLVISRDAGGKPVRMIGTNSDISERKAAEAAKQIHEELIRELAETQTAILDALPANIALIGQDGVILAVNESWRRFSESNHLQNVAYGVGTNYLGVCDRAEGEDAEQARDAATGIRRVLRGESSEFAIEYSAHSPEEHRWFRMMVTPLHEGRRAGAVVKHLNITERKKAEENRLAHERLEQSLALAMQVQQSLLPSSDPTVALLDVAGRSQYCDSTGGDYFDFLNIERGDRTDLFVAVGDVSGHGIAAALLMATARAVVHSNRDLVDQLPVLMHRVNVVLSEDMQCSRFMTMLLAAIDPIAGTLRWSSAGHDAPIVFHPDTQHFEECSESDLVLGIDASTEYAEHVYKGLKPGDLIFIGTDGVWEMHGPQGLPYGKDNLKKFLRLHHRERAVDIADALEIELAQYLQGMPSQDDVTYVVFKIVGAEI